MVADEGCVEDEREPFASKKKEAIEELELDYHCCFTVVDLNIQPNSNTLQLCSCNDRASFMQRMKWQTRLSQVASWAQKALFLVLIVR